MSIVLKSCITIYPKLELWFIWMFCLDSGDILYIHRWIQYLRKRINAMNCNGEMTRNLATIGESTM